MILTKYDYRLACQLGGATDDAVIIRNLPVHLADSARTWLEHLPANQIHDWSDLVRTFVGIFRARTCIPGTLGISEGAVSSLMNPCATTSVASPSSALSSTA